MGATLRSMSGVAASVAASLGFGSHRRRRRPRSPGGEGEEEEERRVAGGDEVGAEEEEDDDDAGGSSGSGAGGGGGGPATKRRRRTSAGAVGTGGPRRFEDVKQEILESKGLVRRSQEEALLRASRSNSGKWQRLVEAATLGGGTLASLGMARKATGASTTFLALSTLAISYLLRDSLKRRGQEAERRLGQLRALEDDPRRIAGLLELLDRDPRAFFRSDEALALLERPRGELLLFREGHLVEEALLGKMRTTGSTAFLRQPHLATICARLRRDYPRLAEGMDAALLLELGDNYSPRALGLKELVEVLVSWQWAELVEGNESARQQLSESLRTALRVPTGSGPKGDLGQALQRIDTVLDDNSISLLKARLPQAYAEYCQGERLLLQMACGWKGGLSHFLERVPQSVLLRRLKPHTTAYSYSSFRRPSTNVQELLELLDALRLLLHREVAWAVERMAARTPCTPSASQGTAKGPGSAVMRRGGAAKALDDLFEGQGWAFAAAHPGLQFLLPLGPRRTSTGSGGHEVAIVPPAALLERVAAKREALARAAQADVERAERAAAAKVAAAAARAGGEMARLDALLAEEQHKEAAALAPLLRRKERVWAAINGSTSYIPIEDTEEEEDAPTSTTTLREKMAALDAARAHIHQVQDAAAARRAELQAQREAVRLRGEREARAAHDIGAAKAAATEAALRSGKEALARDILAAVAREPRK